MKIQDYTLEQLINGLKEYEGKLSIAKQGDKRRTQTKLDITFYQAMATLFSTEIASRSTL